MKNDVFIIAEAGVNHNGERDLALRLVDAAADAGADAVKFQHFNPELLARDTSEMASYQKKNLGVEKSQRDMLSELVMSPDLIAEAAAHAAARGLTFLCTPFDLQSAGELDGLVPAWKVSSTDLTNFPFLKSLAAMGKPLILSSGMATLEETKQAVDFLRPLAKPAGGFPAVSMLHCVSAYPAPLDATNLAVLPVLAEELDVPIGFSDHSLGIGACVGAVALGACILEKHLTLDTALPGPDHKASLEPHELAALVTAARDARRAVGQAVKEPQSCESEHRKHVRRSLHAARDLAAGQTLGEDDLIALRPADGIDPRDYETVLGRTLTHAIAKGSALHPEDLA